MTRSEELRRELEKLHEMLADVDDVDDATVEGLTRVSKEIESVLQAGHAAASPEVESVQQSWNDLVLSFESNHPRLTSILTRITDSLSGIGI